MNISVEGNSNNVAGRDLIFNQEQPLRDRLLEELMLKRNLKYANWKKYNDQRDAVQSASSPFKFILPVLIFDLLFMSLVLNPSFDIYLSTGWQIVDNLPAFPMPSKVVSAKCKFPARGFFHNSVERPA